MEHLNSVMIRSACLLFVGFVTKLCQTLCVRIDCSPPASSVPRNFPGKNTGVGCHFLFQGCFLTQGSKPCLLHWQVVCCCCCCFTNESPGKPYSYIFTLFLCSIWYCLAFLLSKAFSLDLHDLAFS